MNDLAIFRRGGNDSKVVTRIQTVALERLIHGEPRSEKTHGRVACPPDFGRRRICDMRQRMATAASMPGATLYIVCVHRTIKAAPAACSVRAARPLESAFRSRRAR